MRRAADCSRIGSGRLCNYESVSCRPFFFCVWLLLVRTSGGSQSSICSFCSSKHLYLCVPLSARVLHDMWIPSSIPFFSLVASYTWTSSRLSRLSSVRLFLASIYVLSFSCIAMASCGESFRKHFMLWRIPDYLTIGVLAAIAGPIGAKVHPHCRSFSWDDPTISHPAERDIFPTYSAIIAVVLVALLYLVGELVSRWHRPAGRRSMLLHLNGWILTHLYSVVLAFAIVNILKLYAGRLRPRFLAALAAEGITQATAGSFTAAQICHAAREARVSFPSGHSGTAFSGYVPPVLYLFGLCRSLNGGHFWVKTLCLLPLVLPITIAVSRTVDYHHNFDDVLCGSLIGASCGVVAVVAAFRPSARGEWTLRDAPDDTPAAAAACGAAGDEAHLMAQPRTASDNPIEPPSDAAGREARDSTHDRADARPAKGSVSPVLPFIDRQGDVVVRDGRP
ncbi:phosphatidate phosphatase [Strigomonas culicis]|uniref:Phosphatidate phosphatase n=1 Tax=Strigomonas culicis TaxID=28005 RepID=S9TL45_9TRYP|nr:phosphatidate phosphatase [Strigomonas culicis]|eukprot:EPY18932.1 phosphatidate phosphatase [Strigomonas culicis]